MKSDESYIYDTYYVSPDKSVITFPEQKRNLIYIFLESMECTYASTDIGGAREINYITGLTELANDKDSVNFSKTDKLGGASVFVPAISHTMGSTVAQTSGISLNTNIFPLGGTKEFPQVFIELNDYSAKVIRELYTHIAGGPTRLQASTRYIDYEHGFTYVTPHTVEANAEAKEVFDNIMKAIQNGMLKLDGLGIPREDSSMVLPMGMTTKIVMRTNLRHLIDMSRQRMCSRAYWEYRELFADILDALREYSPEWKELIDDVKVFMPKCDALGYCPEKKSCGRRPGKQG